MKRQKSPFKRGLKTIYSSKITKNRLRNILITLATEHDIAFTEKDLVAFLVNYFHSALIKKQKVPLILTYVYGNEDLPTETKDADGVSGNSVGTKKARLGSR